VINMRYKGSSFMEYAIVLGIASLVLVGMNTYIKRGLQGKIKDMTDYFIGKEQAVIANPSATTEAQSKSVYNSDIDTKLNIGGSVQVTSQDTATMEAISRTIDTDIPYTSPPLTPAEAGYVATPTRSDSAKQGSGEGN